MKVCILAGGLGTRLSEETHKIPKPMVEIGGKPMLWHIMKYFSSYGFNEFVILGGYKVTSIIEFFSNYSIQFANEIEINTSNGNIKTKPSEIEDWKITILNTGIDTMTASRLSQARDIIGDNRFFLTYGDGLADINLHALEKTHKQSKATVTLSAVLPEARFGALKLNTDGQVNEFIEKPPEESGWVNGGYMICEPAIFNLIKNDKTEILETDVLSKLALNGALFAFKHYGFWKPMDTLRDKNYLQTLYENKRSPWTIWR